MVAREAHFAGLELAEIGKFFPFSFVMTVLQSSLRLPGLHSGEQLHLAERALDHPARLAIGSVSTGLQHSVFSMEMGPSYSGDSRLGSVPSRV